MNHCVNDILVQGAEPLFFLDYLATGRLSPAVAEAVVGGMAAACRDNGCALLGGETAEMPGFYADGEYDIAGFIVGVVERDRLIDGRAIASGDVLVGVPVVWACTPTAIRWRGASCSSVWGSAWTVTCRSSARRVGDALARAAPVVPADCAAAARRRPHQGDGAHHRRGNHRQPAADSAAGDGRRRRRRVVDRAAAVPVAAAAGEVPADDMLRTFNMGIGLIIVTAPEQAGALINELAAAAAATPA